MEHGIPELSHSEINVARKASKPSPMGLFSMTSALEGRAIPKLKSELNHVSHRIETKQNMNSVRCVDIFGKYSMDHGCSEYPSRLCLWTFSPDVWTPHKHHFIHQSLN